MTQLLEDAISHSITLKKDVKHPKNFSKDEALKLLRKHRSYTLGDAIKLIIKEKLYSETLEKGLEAFLKERNWLIHKCLPYHLDEFPIPTTRDKLFRRIISISDYAIALRKDVDIDLVEFSESIGMDMSNVRAAIRQFGYET